MTHDTTPDKNGWMPIGTAPKDGQKILLAIASDSSHFAREVVRGAFLKTILWGDCWEIEGEYTIDVEGATHWMPLPEPPETP